MRHGSAELLERVARHVHAELRAQDIDAPLAEEPAIRLVDERQRQVRRQAAHELRLAVHHRSISSFTLAQRRLLAPPVGDIDRRADEARELSVLSVTRDSAIEHPAVCAVASTKPIVEFKLAARRDARTVDGQATITIVGMNALRPTFVALLRKRAP